MDEIVFVHSYSVFNGHFELYNEFYMIRKQHFKTASSHLEKKYQMQNM